MLRPVIAATVLGAAVGSLLAASVLFARAEGTPNTVTIDNFSFAPATLTVKAGTTVTWTNKDDIPHGIGSANNALRVPMFAQGTAVVPSPFTTRPMACLAHVHGTHLHKRRLSPVSSRQAPIQTPRTKAE